MLRPATAALALATSAALLATTGCHQGQAKIGSLLETTSGVQIGNPRAFTGPEGQLRMDLHSTHMPAGAVVRSSYFNQESLFALEFAPKTGFRVQEFASGLNAEETHKLAQELDDIHRITAELVAKRLAVTVAEARIARIQADQATVQATQSFINSIENITDAAKADAQRRLEEAKRRVRSAAEDAERMIDTAIDRATSQQTADAVTAEPIAQAAANAITRLNSQILEDNQIIQTLEGKLDTLETNAKKQLSKENVIIARWDDQSDSKTNANVNPFGSASYARSEAQSGYAVIAGFRHVKLAIGDDLQDYLYGVHGYEDARGWFLHGAGIVTASFDAQQIAYISSIDIEERLEYLVEVTATQIAALAAGGIDPLLLAQLRLEVSGYIARVRSLQSQAVISPTSPATFTPAKFPPTTDATNLTTTTPSVLSFDDLPTSSSTTKTWIPITSTVTHFKFLVDRGYLTWR